jgi:peptide/nickel transport system permease protein
MNAILTMIAQRLALGLLTLFVVSLIIFFSVSLMPGDYAEAILGQAALPDTVKAFREQLGLDQPAYVRYFQWLGGVLTGDLGTSFSSERAVTELIGARFGNTMFLAAYAAVIAMPLALVLGVLAALYRNSFYDRTVNVVTLTTISSPEFFLAYVLIMFLSVGLWNGSEMIMGGLFPPIANVSNDVGFWERVYRTTLPAITMTLVIVAHMMRMTRASVINLLASPYIEMANLKGLSKSRIVFKHALPNALAPIINVIAVNMAYLIVGVVLIEAVFVYPGLGGLLVDSVSKRDMPVVQGSCLVFAAVYIMLNLTADVLSIVSNPRLLHPR